MQDAQLVERVVAGDGEAFRQLVERYQRPVFGLLLRMVRTPSVAEDLAQETLIKAYRAIATFDRSRQFSSWLFKIAHNTAIDYLRKSRPRTVPLESDDGDRLDPLALLAMPESQSPEARARGRDLAEALQEALMTLRPDYREAVLLRFQQGLPYDEIADILDLPLGTVKTHLHRARKQMAAALRTAGWGVGSHR
ncbi:MAG: sigma-70 family RNA polymerase sigma factor [Thermoanaerobaculia bacterium]